MLRRQLLLSSKAVLPGLLVFHPMPLLAQAGPAPVDVAPVEQTELGEERSFSGTVMPSRQVKVGSEVAGKVVEFLVRKGARVEAGQVLARLRTRPAALELAAAKSQLQLRQAELAELENGSRPEEIQSARARAQMAKAEHEYRLWAYQKQKQLYEQGSSSEDVLRQAEKSKDTAAAALGEAEANLALLVNGPRKETISQARAGLQAQADSVQQLEDSLAQHEIKAPFGGYVIEEYTEVGAWLTAGASVVELVALDEVEVLVAVPEGLTQELHQGTVVQIGIASVPDEVLQGKVIAIVPQADLLARSFPLRIHLANRLVEKQPLLKAGMLAQVVLPVGAKRPALLLPKDALVLGGPSPMVFVLDRVPGKEGLAKVLPVPVQVQNAFGDRVAVSGKLAKGALVVVEGNERLRPGQEVRVRSRN